MTKIKELFVHPIDREITTVIKMDDLRVTEIEQELSEYVVTDAVEELLIQFLERYAETRTAKTDKIGVWISGFFGSGKSHFAKILSYLLENRQVNGQSAVNLFRLRIAGSSRQREIDQLLHQVTSFIDSQVIAFQIKTEEDLLAQVATEREAAAGNHISTIMYRQWLKKRGLSTTLWIARLELELINLGLYDAFQASVQALEGRPWSEVRAHDMLVRDAAVNALCAIMPRRYNNVAQASKALDDIQAGLQMGPSVLTEELAAWVNGRRIPGSEKVPHLVYIIDEMGQFIGDSNDKLLELQSIAEAFASKGLGKLWLVVTAQEALEEIVREAIHRENEFDKIRDRFNLRLDLTSENIEKVLEERILKKKEAKRGELEGLYRQAEGNIGIVCSLSGAGRPLPIPDMDRFVADYPFPPYQLAILQQIFAAVRTPSGEAQKIEGTERSLIGVTQAILKSPETGFATSPLGRLVALDEVYDQIETELPSIDRRTIAEVAIPPHPTFLKRILKALYLIQKLPWIPCTPENLARLLVTHVDDPRTPFADFRGQIEEGLQLLADGQYVVERDGQYEFLSGVKKDIELEIAAVKVTVNDRRREVKKYLRTVLDIGRLNYEGVRTFDVQVRGDDDLIYAKGEITLQVYSPVYTRATELDRDEVERRSLSDDRTVYWYPAPSDELYRELARLIQTEAVVTRRMGKRDKSSDEEGILRQKQRDVDNAKAKVQLLLRQSLLAGAIIYNGEVRELEGKTTHLNTVFTREMARVIPHVYTRFEPAAVKVSEKSIAALLTAQDTQLTDIEPELRLFDDSHRLNRHSPVVIEVLEELRLRARAGDPRDGKTLSDFFESVPYGWDPILVRIVLAALFRAGIVSLKHEGKVYHDYKAGRAQSLLTRALDFRKTEFLYDPQESLTPEERKAVQKAIDLIFNRREPDTVNIMDTVLREELDALQKRNAEQRILAEQSALPVNPILEEGGLRIADILELAQPDRRLKVFLEYKDTFRDLRRYQEKLQAFIEAGHAADYRRAQALQQAVKRAQDVAPELAGQQVQLWLSEMQAIQDQRQIVEKWATFYQNMQPLLACYQAAYRAQHQARYQVYDQVRAELEALGIDTSALANRLCEGPTGWTPDSLTCTTCGTALETLYYQIQSAPEEKARLIQATARQPMPVSGEQEPTPAIELIRLHQVIRTRKIATVEDLEAALHQLRQAVQTALKAGKQVILG